MLDVKATSMAASTTDRLAASPALGWYPHVRRCLRYLTQNRPSKCIFKDKRRVNPFSGRKIIA